MKIKHLKTVCLVLLLASPALDGSGQGLCPGLITFSNLGGGGGSAVTNSLTGQRVPAGTTFLAALYWAPDGVTDPGLFMQTGASTGFVVPGIFAGGNRYVPASLTFYNFQVRVWESAYGVTYDAAVAAPGMNGRPALRAESNIFRLRSGGAVGSPPDCSNPFTPPSLVSGLQPMVLAVPEPTVLGLGLMGAGLLWCLREALRPARHAILRNLTPAATGKQFFRLRQ